MTSRAIRNSRLAVVRLVGALLPLMVVQYASAADEPIIGLPRDVPFTDHLHQHFSMGDGLPSAWVYDLVQSRDGYIWIATHNGVAKYDGLVFQRFNRSNTSELAANDTRVLYESRDGDLWLGTVGGLTRHRSGRPGRFERFDQFSGNSVHAIFEDSGGRLWIGTREATWVREPEGHFEVATDLPSRVRAICEDSNGSLWFGAVSGLFRLDGDELVTVDPPRLKSLVAGTSRSSATITSLLPDNEGLWVGTSHGLLRVEPGSFPLDGEELGQMVVSDLFRARNGVVYAATGSGLYRLNDRGFASLGTESRAHCIADDNEGGLWIGHTIDRGLHHYQRSQVRSFLTDERVNCLHEDRQGDSWFGTFTGLYRRQGDELIRYGLEDGLPHAIVQAIAQGDGDTLWIGTRSGLVWWTGKKLEPVDGPEELGRLNVASVFVESSGTIWLAAISGGAQRFKDGELEPVPELDHGQVSWFHEDGDGKLWIGHEYGLYQYADGKTKQVTAPSFEELNSRHFRCHYAARDGTLWLGTTGGILRYQNGRFDAVTSEHGLAADYVDCIQDDSHGNTWFSGRDGVFYVNASQLHAVASREQERLTCHRLKPVEGVPVSNHAPKSYLTDDGEMWMVAKRGLIRVSSEPFVPPLPPSAKIDQVQLDGQIIPAENDVDYQSGRHRLAIHFAAPTFRASQELRVKYRLVGSDGDWIDAAGERVAHYTDLAPGNYRFEVMVASGDVWNRQAESLELNVRPRWWERTQTRALAGIGFLGLVVLYARMRTRRYRRANIVLRREIEDRKRAEEQSRRHQDELARIARAASMGEMATSIAHEIRQPLFAIMTDAKTATRLLNKNPPDIDEVEDALGGIASGGNRASEIIDRIQSLVRKEATKKQTLDLNRVTRDVIAFLEPELRSRDVVLHTELSDDLPSIAGDEIQLQQVLINLIINGAHAMKGSETPRRLLVATWPENESVVLSVRDSGVGIDESQIDRMFEPFYTTKTSGIGMGLAVNRTIIRAHGGQIWATANDGPGATFQIRLPSVEPVSHGDLADVG